MLASRSIRTLGIVLLSLVILLAAGSLTARAQSPSQDPLELGARLFAENCAVCHGMDGQGRVGATLSQNWPSVRPDLTVKSVIERGVPGSLMPAWSDANGGPLNTSEIDALVAFILSWQTTGSENILVMPTFTPLSPVTPVPDVTGDPTRGAALFQQNCVMCHGEGGQGKIGKTLARTWDSVRPDLLIKSTILNGVPGSVMPVFGQANGGPLSEQDANDVVAFVLAMPKAQQVRPTAEVVGSQEPGWMSGWGGVLVFIVLVGAILAFAVWIQRRK